MSYGIVRVQKFTKGSVKGIEIHDRRVKDGVSHTNKDIDWERTKENYDLHPACNLNFTQAVNVRISSLKLSRAVRKDAVVMAQVLVTSDKSFFDGLSREQQKQFFHDSYELLKNRYGAENIISATVHLDEKTPHMHFNFVPVTANGRLAAKDVLTRKNLINQQDQFFSEVGKKYSLERGVAGGIKTHLETAELKLKTARSELAELEDELDYADHSLVNMELKTEAVIRELAKKETKVRELVKLEQEIQEKLAYTNAQVLQVRQLAEDSASRIEREANEKASKIVSEGQARVEALEKRNEALQGKIAVSEKRIKELRRDIQNLEGEFTGKVLTKQGFDKINPQKGMFDMVRNISIRDIDDLKATAMRYIKAKSENESLKNQIKDLKNENKGLRDRIKQLEPSRESVIEKLGRKDELKLLNEFRKLPSEEQKRLLSMAKRNDQANQRRTSDFER